MVEVRTRPRSWNSGGYDYLHDTETERDYKRIVGGLAWPGANPGYAVVLGLSLHGNPQTFEHDVWVMGEAEGAATNLFDSALDMTWRMKVGRWYGNTANEPMLMRLHMWQRGRSDKLNLINAPLVEHTSAFEMYLSLIEQSLSSECKVLQLFGSTLPAKLQELPVAGAKGDDHPAVLALGYALAALDIYKPGRARDNVEYVPFDERLGI